MTHTFPEHLKKNKPQMNATLKKHMKKVLPMKQDLHPMNRRTQNGSRLTPNPGQLTAQTSLPQKTDHTRYTQSKQFKAALQTCASVHKKWQQSAKCN
jgi:hypothetical protein